MWRRIDFWRFAFSSASDEAFRQFESLKESIELLIEDGVLRPEQVPFTCLGGKRIAQLCDKPEDYYDSEDDASAEEKYTKKVDYLAKLSVKHRISWVTDQDKAFILKWDK